MPQPTELQIHPLARLLAPAVLAIAILGLAGCGADADTSPASPGSKAAKDSNGLTLASEDWKLDATASAGLMPGYVDAPLSFRLATGWINADAAKAAGKEADAQAQREQALASFGMVTVAIAAGTAEPGTYQLGGEVDGADTAAVTIPLGKDTGLAGEYTSQSGSLTIKSVDMEESRYSATVRAVDGSFDGVFADDQGATRPISGTFRFTPKTK
ncbi:hypothetical protein INQ41_01405 [Lysobacter ciconiae]|uniref:Uncharacterized protein n=1 Tax=Novilysobacter ciconiae TaxID=2781022 RepID=A0A7S6UGA9_9GAMM|nr:hypothetical protein [Lysobacter ciconiae]QOW19763.1 hypothetical protein INQ41_01405 [Lysobacter ciconiae]